ncbi:MAG: T9SS type A sorting domain-containing protein [Flavobacteriales bacterium]|nr:T9SS type A sorting domain-containing protein [Flavobacteriales bacterium]
MNTYAHENAFEILDETGNAVFSRTGLAPGTYADSVFLAAGCYKIRYIDTVSLSTPNSGNDGISWWANPTQGTGYFRVRVNGVYELLADPDFGAFFEHSFYIDNTNSVDENEQTRTLSIYPNPTNDNLNINFYGFENDVIQVQVLNESGKLVKSEYMANDRLNLNRKVLETSDLSAGIYFIRFIDKNVVRLSKFVKQ